MHDGEWEPGMRQRRNRVRYHRPQYVPRAVPMAMGFFDSKADCRIGKSVVEVPGGFFQHLQSPDLRCAESDNEPLFDKQQRPDCAWAGNIFRADFTDARKPALHPDVFACDLLIDWKWPTNSPPKLGGVARSAGVVPKPAPLGIAL